MVNGPRHLRIDGPRWTRSRRPRSHRGSRVRSLGDFRRLRRRGQGRLRLLGPGWRWQLRSRDVRLFGPRIEIRNLRYVNVRIISGLVYRVMEDLIQFVPLPRVDDGGRVSIHNDRKKIAAGQASWMNVTGKFCAGNTYITTQIPYADFPTIS